MLYIYNPLVCFIVIDTEKAKFLYLNLLSPYGKPAKTNDIPILQLARRPSTAGDFFLIWPRHAAKISRRNW